MRHLLARAHARVLAKDGRPIETTKIAWGEPIEGSSRTILADFENGESEPSKVDEAKQFLEREFSKRGTHQSTALIAKAKEHGIGRNSLRQAADELKGTKTQDRLYRWLLDVVAIAELTDRTYRWVFDVTCELTDELPRLKYIGFFG